MKLGGWLSAAIEILSTIEERHLPAKHCLADWGRSHRFAGSKDRAAIGNLVYDVLRSKASLAWIMDDESARALALAAAVKRWGETAESLNAAFSGDKFAPELLNLAEQKSLEPASKDKLKNAPLWVQANIPAWLEPQLHAQFGDQLRAEGQAMAKRAPVDVRVNHHKATSEKCAKALARFHPETTKYASTALRFGAPEAARRAPNLEAEAAHGKGWFEVQDAGSQIACLLSGAKPGDQLLDLCAGAGGKTLALSAMMENKGQIHAYDIDKQRLRPIFERLKRAGCRNVQTHEANNEQALQQLEAAMDIVFVDAPCTGTGTWRRHPDAKWRLSENALKSRLKEQVRVLETAAKYVKPGGKLVYVTCSLLPSENQDQIDQFLTHHSNFEPSPLKQLAQQNLKMVPETIINDHQNSLTLSPAQNATDGFFISVLNKP